MGLIAGLVIGLLCRRLVTAAGWCAGVALVTSTAFAGGVVWGGHAALVEEAMVLPALALVALVPLAAGALLVLGVKRLFRRRPAPAPVAIRFGASPAIEGGV